MDSSENSPITTSRIAGAMNYPSTTQALFALIVMIIVLLFILVYCCWGTFSCARQDESPHNTDDGAAVVREIQGTGGRGNRMVIVPFSNMIYVGDPESRRIYEIPVEQDKPPAYTEVFDGVPPPPYSTDSQGRGTPVNGNSNNATNTRPALPDHPPSYSDCLTTTTADKWPEVLQALISEHAKKMHQESRQPQSEEQLVTQLPALRMPSMMMVPNDLLPNQQSNTVTDNTPFSSNTNSAPCTESAGSSPPTALDQSTESEQIPPPSVTANLLDPWTPPPPPPVWNQNENESDNSFLTSLPPAYTASPIDNYVSTEDSLSNATDEDFMPTQASTTTSDTVNMNDNQGSNTSQSRRENLHSAQDYSRV